MKITLLTKEQHDEILSIYEVFPELTLQNKGYEYIDKSKLPNEAKDAFKAVENILKANIVGFSSFTNFKVNKDGEIQLRFDYNYNYGNNERPFTGVGYILLSELLNGFDY